MSKIITQCPSCEDLKLKVIKIECAECSTRFEGEFEIPDLLKLSEEDLKFIIDFVKCSGSLKEMASKQKISYPTLRNRLNLLIESIEQLAIHKTESRLDILQQIEEGKISAIDAAKMLYKLRDK